MRDGNDISKVILPVHGPGLFSTLYGLLALEGDFSTVAGLTYYEHGDTPGLGGEVGNPDWQALWVGKAVFDDDGDVRLEVVKGSVDAASPNAIHQVDGLSGATLTSQGVTNMMQYWLGADGFGPFLARMESGEALDG